MSTSSLAFSPQGAVITALVSISIFLITQIINWFQKYVGERKEKEYVSKLLFLLLYDYLKKFYKLREMILNDSKISREDIGLTGFLFYYHSEKLIEQNISKLVKFRMLHINSFQAIIQVFDIGYRLNHLLDQFYPNVEKTRIKNMSKQYETEEQLVLPLSNYGVQDDDYYKWRVAYDKIQSFFYYHFNKNGPALHRLIAVKQALKLLFNQAKFSKEEVQADFDNILDELDGLYK